MYIINKIITLTKQFISLKRYHQQSLHLSELKKNIYLNTTQLKKRNTKFLEKVKYLQIDGMLILLYLPEVIISVFLKLVRLGLV